MDAVKLFEKKDVPLDWEYDGEADTLYLSFGKPRAALGVDVFGVRHDNCHSPVKKSQESLSFPACFNEALIPATSPCAAASS